MKLFTTAFWNDARRKRDWAGLLALFILAAAFPIRTGSTRTATLLLGALVWSVGIYVFRRSRPALAAFIAIAVAVLFAAAGPGRPYDKAALRQEYVSCLRGYTGVKYVWGGENALGIDCSGLVREGLITASLRRGLVTVNPALLRMSFSIWRHDCTAAQLGQGYRGNTYPLQETPSLAELDYRTLLPGDIAVTDSGAHTLAYLGDRTWIEADPGDYAGKVIQVTVPQSRNPWLFVPMRILRWRELG